MKCKVNVIQGIIKFDTEHSIAALLRLIIQVYPYVKYTANSIIDIMGFNTIIIHRNFISGIKNNRYSSDI